VIHNTFRDEEPVIRDGKIVNFGSFGEDLLSIERLQQRDGLWVTAANGHALDLGWYPDADPRGAYRLTLIHGDWNHVVGTFVSRNRAEIASAVEHWLAWATEGLADDEIGQRIADLAAKS
jgi:hypothetical protein